MTHLFLFSGAGGFDLGFEWAGHESVAQVEFDPHCREVLARHWPEVPKYEDVREFDGSDFAGVGIISGGFPCQDLSVAGKRKGLSGARSGLFFELARIVDEARPEFLVWENVPGLLSADSGGAMGAVLHTLADIGYFGCYRVLDSQHFGVAQRRRRVFGVFAEGRAGGERCAELLLEPEGGGWTPAPRGQAGEDVARCLDSGSGGDSGKEQQRTFVPDVSYTCQARDGKGISQREGVTTLVASSITASAGHHGHSSPRGDGGDNLVAAVAPTLEVRAQHGYKGAETQLQCDTTGVRRLVPAECERLQGFPGGWTEFGSKGALSDTHRYRMMGNAVTTNVVYWLALRMKETL